MKTKIYKTAILKAILTVLVILIGIAAANAQPAEDWIQRFNYTDKNDGANAMKVDKEGNVYITGYSEGKESGKDFQTVKYSASGVELWYAAFSSDGNSDGDEDIANDLAVDEKGNVYVTGFTHSGVAGTSFCTIKYDSKGTQEWVSFYSSSRAIEFGNDKAVAIQVDRSGDVIVAGTTGYESSANYTTIKYNSGGSLVWARTIDGAANGNDEVKGLALDSEGNIIVTGVSVGFNFSEDYLTIKYDASGEEIWSDRFNGLGGNIVISDDEPSSIATDKFNNVYVTGYSYGPGTGKDFLTIKYNSKGEREWLSRFDNAALQRGVIYDDEARGLAVDEAGNIIVTGKTESSKGGSEYLTVKIDADGNTIWSKIYNSDAFDGSIDEANGVAVDRKGNVYVTGFINGWAVNTDCGNERGKDFYTIKYSSKGIEQWGKQYNGTGSIGNNDDVAKAIALDGKGRIFIMGESMGEETELDYCVIGYNEFFPFKDLSASEDKAYYILSDNYPNPFNPTTRISFEIPVSSNVKLSVYDMTGREISTLVNNTLQAGMHEYEWNAAQFSSGTYFYKIQADGFVKTKRMLLIK